MLSKAILATTLLALLCASFVSAAQVNGKWFDRVFIIMLENMGYNQVISNAKMQAWANKGTLLTNYYAVTHPSQPNYIAMTAGSFFNIIDDFDHNINATNIVDLLEAKNVPWKGYMEGYPGNCFTGAVYNKYYRKHNPFMSFDNVRNNPQRCAKIVPAEQLDIDIAGDALPSYMYYTPDIDNDGHNTDVNFAASWLTAFLEPKMRDPRFSKNTLVIITFDEDEYKEDNHIFTTLLGPMVAPAAHDTTLYNHYSLLRTVEDNFALGTLNRHDATASSFKCFV